ncbi:hypothetical protein B0T21DRAFT_355645 [Apiosordaria backusii]|uniref:Secreted protein n=1 Tax=Apiosordaria backusii TaxID=314023 RepID=A0AA40K6P9_9PEZI|nr:hypothetical protein B0T21DRAFT_355645 [Apiosordaria backusii]
MCVPYNFAMFLLLLCCHYVLCSRTLHLLPALTTASCSYSSLSCPLIQNIYNIVLQSSTHENPVLFSPAIPSCPTQP